MEPMERLKILDFMANLHEHLTNVEQGLVKMVKEFPTSKSMLDECAKASMMCEKIMNDMGLNLNDGADK